MSPTLSNTQVGHVQKPTLVSTITKGVVVQLTDGAGLATVAIPGADGFRPDFLAIEDAYADDTAAAVGGGEANSAYLVTCQPLDSNRSIRVVSTGTIAGGTAVMAEGSTGKIKTLSGSGVWSIGILEEDCIIGQLALVRPVVWKQ